MSKGFITIATGNERYFKMAVNLLKSYRLFCENPLPFAILADRRNQYTDQFDEVIILENAKCTYIDKLSILINCPYDETIFIDADCLAYHDLNDYWDVCDFSYTLTCFGNSLPLDNKHEGYFAKENIGEFEQRIKFIPHVHGGVYFIKNSPECAEMFKLAMYVNENYSKFKFNHFPEPADESILALCMAVFDCRPIREKGWHILFYPVLKNFKADISKGINSCFKYREFVTNAYLVHWGNYFTKWADYKSEVDKLNVLFDNKYKIDPSDFKFDLSTRVQLKIKRSIYKSVDFFKKIFLVTKSKLWHLLYRKSQKALT